MKNENDLVLLKRYLSSIDMENVNSRAYVSVMAQYFPTYKAKEDKYLNRKLTNKEYSEIEQYLYLLDIENGYMQDLGKHEEEYVPDF